MRIDQYHLPNVDPAEAARQGQKSAEMDAQARGGTASDRVDLSRLSQALSGGVEPEVRVEQLREAVASGSYQVPAAELSRRMVEALLSGED
jgi:anti-sigma28 factor (negative regulator of flagellin synthesis)